MGKRPAPANDEEKRQIRQTHPLVRRMRGVRRRHGRKLVDVEACMQKLGVQIPFETLKQIEGGRRPLPPLISFKGAVFADWFTAWQRCVGCLDDERAELEDLLMLIVIGHGIGQQGA